MSGRLRAVRADGLCANLLNMTTSNPLPGETFSLAVSPSLTDDELNALFEAAWPHHQSISFARTLAHSLCWVGARLDGTLVGFVNVATDGGSHAFILDTTVHPRVRRRGLGVRLVETAVSEARSRGAEWLHVDYEPQLEEFYTRCGFRPTAAGVLPL
jgi:GNAT superfamily N-acetyltransferase